jgi:hypothetical protein
MRRRCCRREVGSKVTADKKEDAKSAGPSYVLVARDYADIAHLENPSVIERILSSSRTEKVAYVSSLLTSGLAKYALAGPKVAVAALAVEALTDFGREVSEWVRTGRLPEDFSGRPSGYQTWVELLQEIDSNAVDAARLKAMKAMFLAANEINATDAQSVVAYQLFQIAKKLSSGELLLLRAVYDSSKNNEFSGAAGNVTLEGWAQAMSGHLGHGLFTLVIRDSIALEENGLINGRVAIGAAPHQQNQNWVNPINSRITNLGVRFCENIRNYEVLVKE